MTLSHIILLLSLFALILTKIADIVTTARGMRRWGVAGEKNPLARRAMQRWGVAWGITAVMVLWVLVVLATYLPMWVAPGWMHWPTAALGFFVAGCQGEVARMNATGRHSWFTRLMLRVYQNWHR